MKKIVMVLLILGGGIWGGHFYLSSELEKSFHHFVKTQEKVGTKITYDSYHTKLGFLGLTIVLKNPSLVAEESWIQKASIEGDLYIKIALLSSQNIQFSSKGISHLSWKSPDPKGPLFAEFASFTGHTSLNEYGRLYKTEVDFSGTKLFYKEREEPLLRSEGGHLKFSKKHEKKKFKFHLKTKPIFIHKKLKTPFGNEVELLDFKAFISDIDQSSNFQASLRDWYDSSGTMEIDHLKFKWGPLDINSKGTFSLDEKLQPLIALSAKVKNMNNVLKTLVAEKIISKKSVTLVQLVLGALSQMEEGEIQHKFALTLQEGELSLGPIPIIQGVKIDWG